jgi:hypothetical protein
LIPSISLKQVQDLGILNKKEVKLKKEKIVESYFDNIEGLDEYKKSKIIDKIKTSDLKISTKEFLNDKNVLKLSEGI